MFNICVTPKCVFPNENTQSNIKGSTGHCMVETREFVPRQSRRVSAVKRSAM